MCQGRASSLPVLVPHLLAPSFSMMYFEVRNKSDGYCFLARLEIFQKDLPGMDLTLTHLALLGQFASDLTLTHK